MRILAVAGAMALMAFGHAAAQDQDAQAPRMPVLAGVGGYLGLGLQSGIFPVYAGSPDCGLFTSGNVIPLWAGGIYTRPSHFAPNLGFSVRLGWEGAASLYTAPPDDIQRIVDTTTHTLVQIDRRFQYETAIQAVMLDLLAHYQVGNWGFELGPRIGYRYSVGFRQTDNVIGPGQSSFADGERQHDMPIGTRFTPLPIALGGGFGVSYAASIGGNRYLVPMVVVNGDILSIVSEQQWRSISLGAGMAFQLDVAPAAPPTPPPVITEPPRPRRLAASLKIQGMDEQKRMRPEAVINVRTILYRQHAPLLPHIFFDAGSAAIPERYTQLPPNAVAGFSMMAVPEMSQIGINHALLNIIGTRMRDEPAARLTLQGLASDEEPTGLGLERARSVRNYLATSWGIDRARIDVRAGESPAVRPREESDDERAESRRVLITSNDPNILAPVASERIIRDFDPPSLKLEPTIDAEAGVRDWTIVIRQGSTELTRFTHRDEQSTGLTWRLDDERIDSTISTLTAELRVEDSTGQVRTVSDQIALRVNRDTRVEKGIRDRGHQSERLSYTLVAFDYRSATLTPEHRELLAELAEALHDSARVTVVGYTDRTGDDRVNAELSRQRAESAADALRPLAASRGVSDITLVTSGAGVDTDRFPNDLPEGRILSRSAAITVEQPPADDGRP